MSDEKRRVILRKGGRPRREEPAAPEPPKKPSGKDEGASSAGAKGHGRPQSATKASDSRKAGAARPKRTATKPVKAAPTETREAAPRVIERTPEQEAAHELSKSQSIPVVHAHRVLRGEASLEEVKDALSRKDEATRLAREEGLAPSLAGQVAAGHLKVERARILQRLRSVRPQPIDWDAFKIALEAKEPIALATFESGWRVGKILSVDIYEFRFGFLEEGGVEQEIVVQKHDVKAICDPTQLAAVQEAVSIDETVREESLGASAKRNTRVRPEDEELAQMLETKRPFAVVLRDGERWAGSVASFGRWDVTLRLYGGTELVVLFHALHPKTLD
jgi:hypothetical protein